jgi:hypothetical protein
LDAVCSGTPETVDPDTPSLVPSEGNTEEGTRREVGNSLWPADADPARLEFVSSWPIPRSTDILQTFSWGTLDALKLILTKPNSQETAKNTPPAYSDHKYDYYQVSLERARSFCLFQDSSIEAIRQSRQWQEERSRWEEERRQWEEEGIEGEEKIRQWEKSAAAESFTTTCLTLGLLKQSAAEKDGIRHNRCIVYAVMDSR